MQAAFSRRVLGILLMIAGVSIMAWAAVQFFSPASPREEPIVYRSTPEAEYLALEAGLFDKTTLRPDKTAVDTIVGFLEKIRAEYPEMKEMRVADAVARETSLIVGLDEAAAGSHLCGEPGESVAPSTLHLTDKADAITRRFGGSYGPLICFTTRQTVFVEVRFSPILHRPSLIALYRKVPGVLSVENNFIQFGGVNPVEVTTQNQEWHVVFGRGWGDCPAGCIHKQYFFFLVSSDGSVRKNGETGEPYDPFAEWIQ